MKPVTTILLLDFDGPLSNLRTTFATGDTKAFDPIAIGMLKRICDESGGKIVCTSTRAALDNDMSYARTIARFQQAGMSPDYLHPDWSCRYDNGPRQGHIQKYLFNRPEILKYAVIDDKYLPGIQNLILVDRFEGISFADGRKICRAIGVDEEIIFADIARKNKANDDPALRYKRIILPQMGP